MYKAARRIVERLRRHHHEAFFAGGWVRDFLLRRAAKDIDVVTSARPSEVQALFPGSIPVGASFGVVLVRMYGLEFEVATFRTEGPYLDGRHPSSVTFAGPEQDARRRDFTINGLYYDPVAERVIDFVQGRSDLRDRIVRTIGPPLHRFGEDKLRMFRAVRFACALDFALAEDTSRAIRQMAPEILQVSAERIRDELCSILTGPRRGRGLDLMQELGLLRQVLPEVEAMRGVPQPEEYHPEGDVYVHTRRALELLRNPTPVLAMAALLHDAGKPPTYSVEDRIRFHGHAEAGVGIASLVCRRLRFSNAETEQVVDLVRNHLRFMHAAQMKRSTLQRFIRKPNFADHLELHRVDCLSSHGRLDAYWLCRREWERARTEPAATPRLITGKDLVDLGLTPGPVFREILRAVEDMQLEGEIQTREGALDFVRRTFAARSEDPKDG
ncbi:MAG: CCA tRNA nucleotidyltransferase [Acidobacteria bacterium]|nr:CCA tRNA nucleotidyltransferase [Acidobacteriota bacterium]